MLSNNEKGKLYEDKACDYLKSIGHKILAKNYKNKYGEIDIISEHKGYVIFVEVKFRTTINFGAPTDAVNKKKQKKIVNCSLMYLSLNNIDNMDIRYDVISILDNELEHIENAFYAH